MSDEFTRAYRDWERTNGPRLRVVPTNEERAAYFAEKRTSVAEQVDRRCFNGALEVLADIVRGAVLLVWNRMKGKRK